MQLRAQARQIASELKQGLVVFLRSLRRLLDASRLPEMLAYVLACLLVLFPIAFVGKGLNWALASSSTWFALTVVMIAAVFMTLFAGLMANEQFLKDVRLQGIRWPSLLSIALAWLAVLVFGGMSCGFQRVGIVQIEPSVPVGEGCATRYADFYLWHLLDSIPGIKFNETVGWQKPYEYSDNLSGWLLVGFKILVIFFVIKSFVVSGRISRETDAKPDVYRRSANKGDA